MDRNSTNAMILLLSFSNVVSNIFTITSGFLVARWVLPDELGQYSLFTIISAYIVLIQFGVPSALGRELPFHLGKGDKTTAYRYTSVAQYWQKALGSSILIVSVVVSVLMYFSGHPQVAAGALTVGVVTWQALYVTKYLKVLYRTTSDFNRISYIKLIVAVFSFASIALVWLYGFYGLCARAIFIAIVDFALSYTWRPIRVKAAWSASHFKTLVSVGLPMFSIASLYGLWPLLQRTFVHILGGTQALGLFSLATMVENGMVTVSSSMNNVIYPKMATAWGEGRTVGEIIHSVYKPIFFSIFLFLLLLPVAWYLMPPLVQAFLPNYSNGVKAAQFMLLVGAIEPATGFLNIYNVMKNQRDRLTVYVSGVAIWGLCTFAFWKWNGFSLAIFPIAMFIAIVAMVLINFGHILKYWHTKASDVK